MLESAIETSNESPAKNPREPRRAVPTPIDPIAEALALSTPWWPLQNAVAVNPFWGFRGRSFHSAISDLADPVGHPLYMPLSYFLAKYREGVIGERALGLALREARERFASVPPTVDELVRCSTLEDRGRTVLTLAELRDRREKSAWQSLITHDLSKHAAAYFDESQAVAPYPWRSLPFWQAWREASRWDRSMDTAGARGFSAAVARLVAGEPRPFILASLARLGLHEAADQARYLSRLMATALGWSSRFSLAEWQRGLGDETMRKANPIELLAVLVAYDLALAEVLPGDARALADAWREDLVAARAGHEARHPYALHAVWQSALEISYQARVAARMAKRAAPQTAPYAHVVMCIDVRSEPLRRALEATDEGIRTAGFAGFFGLPLATEEGPEGREERRLPVLLKPVLRGTRADTKSGEAALAPGRAFFRHLRKLPLSSLPYVELFGIYALGTLLRRSAMSLFAKLSSTKRPRRFQAPLTGPGLTGEDEASLFDRAAAILRHMGLTRDFAPLVVLAGHGTACENNAFGSTLDCGACGGHAGDVNARALAALLNDEGARRGIAERGIRIPEGTHFVAAVHETVTDRVHIFGTAPTAAARLIERLEKSLATASDRTRAERQTARSPHTDRAPESRSSDWSEVRPEWGLAGNAAFLVAPRAWTRGVNLDGRAFLHDYNASRDNDYATLELIMTAPMIVTNWINMQYYASTVAPPVYGSGDKTLHNLVGETGVVEGNGGDLRVGLPLQSVHDGSTFVHEPLRLSVFLAAPRPAIESIIAKHAVVRELVDNEWLLLLHLDEDTGHVARRLPGGVYETLTD